MFFEAVPRTFAGLFLDPWAEDASCVAELDPPFVPLLLLLLIVVAALLCFGGPLRELFGVDVGAIVEACTSGMKFPRSLPPALPDACGARSAAQATRNQSKEESRRGGGRRAGRGEGRR